MQLQPSKEFLGNTVAFGELVMGNSSLLREHNNVDDMALPICSISPAVLMHVPSIPMLSKTLLLTILSVFVCLSV